MLSACKHTTLRLELKEFLVSVYTCEHRCKVGIDEHGPSVRHFATLRILFLIMTENIPEQAQGIATIVRAKILDLSFHETRELVNDALKRFVVELVEDA